MRLDIEKINDTNGKLKKDIPSFGVKTLYDWPQNLEILRNFLKTSATLENKLKKVKWDKVRSGR